MKRGCIPIDSHLLKGLFSFKEWRMIRRETSCGKVETVYFIVSDETGLVKIGKAKNPKRRLRELKTGCPSPLRLVAAFDSVFRIERGLHRLFAKYREHGEWFEYSDEIKNWIREASLCATGRLIVTSFADKEGREEVTSYV